jgi:hypothetical protein
LAIDFNLFGTAKKSEKEQKLQNHIIAKQFTQAPHKNVLNSKKMIERNFWKLLNKHLQEKNCQFDSLKLKKRFYFGN